MAPKRPRTNVRYTDHDFARYSMPEPLPRGDERSHFERDRSRIIHSAAFRRLQGKTQVFTAGEGDFFRTRLTHSLEVAQIAKGIALRLRADPDLVEAAALLHDIGHPPFGHAGERVLKKAMAPYGGFEANAQNIRVVTLLETKSERYNGLNLTRAVLDGQMKYKTPFPGENGKFVYGSDIQTVRWASDKARTVATNLDPDTQSFECQIMDWADDVAYAVHDLEDSVHARFIDSSTFVREPLRGAVIEELSSEFEVSTAEVTRIYDSLLDEMRGRNPDYQLFAPIITLKQKKSNRKGLTSYLIGRYIKATGRVDAGSSTTSNRYLHRICIPVRFKIEVALIKKVHYESRFSTESPQVRTIESKKANTAPQMSCR